MDLDPGQMSDDQLIAAHAQLAPSAMSDEGLQYHHQQLAAEPSTADLVTKAVLNNLPAGNEFGALAAGAASAMSYGSKVLEKTTEPAGEQAKVLSEAGKEINSTVRDATQGVPGLQLAAPFATEMGIGLAGTAASFIAGMYGANVGMYQRVNTLLAQAAEESGFNPLKSSDALMQQAIKTQQNLEPLNFWEPATFTGGLLGYGKPLNSLPGAVGTVATLTKDALTAGKEAPGVIAKLSTGAVTRGGAGAVAAEIAPYSADADTKGDERYPGTAAVTNIVLGPGLDKIFKGIENVGTGIYGQKSPEIAKAAQDTGITLTKGEQLDPGFASAMRGRDANALKPQQQQEAYKTIHENIESFGLPKEVGDAMIIAHNVTKDLSEAVETQKSALYTKLNSKLDPSVSVDLTKPVQLGEQTLPAVADIRQSVNKIEPGETYKGPVEATQKVLNTLPDNPTFEQLKVAQVDAQAATNAMFDAATSNKVEIPPTIKRSIKQVSDYLDDRVSAHTLQFVTPEEAAEADAFHKTAVVPMRAVLGNNSLGTITGLVAGSIRGDISRSQLSSLLTVLPPETQRMARNAIVGNILKQAADKSTVAGGELGSASPVIKIGDFVKHTAWLEDNPLVPQATKNMRAGFAVLMNHPNLSPMLATPQPQSLIARTASGEKPPALPKIQAQNAIDSFTSGSAAVLAALLDFPPIAGLANIAGQAYGRDNAALAAAVSTQLTKLFHPVSRPQQDPQRGK